MAGRWTPNRSAVVQILIHCQGAIRLPRGRLDQCFRAVLGDNFYEHRMGYSVAATILIKRLWASR